MKQTDIPYHRIHVGRKKLLASKHRRVSTVGDLQRSGLNGNGGLGGNGDSSGGGGNNV